MGTCCQLALSATIIVTMNGAWFAHELKNALAVVKALVDVGLRETEEIRARHVDMAIAVARIETLVRDYLAASLSADERSPVALDAIVADVLGRIEPRAIAAGVALARRLDGVTVVGDARRLRDVVENLVGNAIEAVARGGRVEVAVGADGDDAVLEVRDDGPGIAPEHRARLGVQIVTTRPGGTGLGVVIARTIVERHGGTLAYADAPGGGTIATVRLPRQR